ncbi:urease accessory protein UreE [Altericista sp. CCNU0014]|uniref:urease accessory protein UreE n=1 Tax=Altericista sp. CCNU0014 TaxID=3082949 RepID=UPI00384C251F
MSQEIAIVALTQRQSPNAEQVVQGDLVLSAEERLRSRYRCQTEDGIELLLDLPRGTVLQEGDLLTTATADWRVRVRAKAEPVLSVEAASPLDLLRMAYHLGNRHVPVEVTLTALKLSPDPVLREMLEHLGAAIAESNEPFYPETGAYRAHA